MPVSVRLDRETRDILERTAVILGTTKTDVIKKSIRDFCLKELKGRTAKPFDLIQDLIGGEGSGKGDLSVRGEEILRERFQCGR